MSVKLARTRSHTSLGTNLVAVVKDCSLSNAFPIDDLDGAAKGAQHVLAREDTTFARVSRSIPPVDPISGHQRHDLAARRLPGMAMSPSHHS